ncbi:MAG TPA: carboxypeptidase-like regulatory domain-containing protein [Longimicrobiaceae bacterium]|nr:carboxypeptidase-like regulatory domain-containing protein [Longimicrobiaceae bacterium]
MRGDIRMDRGSRPVILLLALTAALLLAGFRGAGEPERIVGRVTDAVGTPLGGATVSARSAAAQGAERSAQTGDTGGFQLAGLPPGRYTLRAEREGYAPAEQTAEVAAGERTAVIFRLRPSRR